eukprot:TRINITY_DN1276_c0_g1_i2.p1 TRINITY_DN1276_c0_g1~~TRINITY_DN1276_c0_g1_i2.p1  ORF type:complete len:472 (-),score=85.33 TRINITY_DN1276_c0_g1_i2:72-1487(-)
MGQQQPMMNQQQQYQMYLQQQYQMSQQQQMDSSSTLGYLTDYFGNQLMQNNANLEDGASSAAPAYWVGQNAWLSQTIGQNYQDQLAQAYYGHNRTGYGAAHQMLPNKQSHPGVPNKSGGEDGMNMDGLGFFLDESPLDLPDEECITDEDEVGQCMSPHKCGTQSGEPKGLCHQGMDASAHLRTCCVFPSFCGFESNKEVVYFKSPDYPQTSKSSPECHFRTILLPDVCQIRVDFLDFDLKGKTNGKCEDNHQLKISSPFKRAFIPADTFCGALEKEQNVARTDLKHIYIHFDDIPLDSNYSEAVHHKDPHVDFKITSLNHPARWNLRISQILCDGAPLHAPSGCGQYYNAQNGTIRYLDIAELSKEGKLSSCIRTDTSACAVKYNIKDMQIGEKKKLGYGLTCQNYMSINGMKSGICGQTADKEIILPIHGPQAVNFVHERPSKTAEGYSINYEYLHSCKAAQFFKYPNAK